MMIRVLPAMFVFSLVATACLSARTAIGTEARVTVPLESFFEMVSARDREAARAFYRKHLDVNGMPVVAAAEVDDRALERTHEIVTHMLAGRSDVVDALVKNRMYLIVIGKDQVYIDMPEYRNHPNPAFQYERVRGTGGRPTSFGEENLLSLPIDRYDDESIAVHEFCHTIDGTLRSIDTAWNERKNAAFQNARRLSLHKDTYAGSNAGEYWAEICQAYFDCNRVNNWDHGPVGSREQLRAYDPEGYELVRSIFRLKPDQDWRYSWVQKLPNVAAPPARFQIDPYYTKFTWAREFPVVGREASDDALLKANDTIRKLFAYRHDILKALIADGVKLVVLGRDERIADLPEIKNLKAPHGVDALSRTLDFDPEARLLVVGEDNVLADPREPSVGDCQVIRVFANAIHHVVGARPVDLQWENRPRGVWQQYELRVDRLDSRFDDKLKLLFEAAVRSGKWQGTAAVHGRTAYWTAGVLAYFDADGQAAAPIGANLPVTNRESLKNYDADLAELVHETFGYRGKVDWRYKPAK
jgi:alpha-glucosidase